MNKIQKSKLRIYKVVHSVCLESSAVTAAVSTFSQVVTDLGITIGEIERLSMVHSTRNKGITKQNVLQKELLVEAITRIGGG